jgi:hypothetical protein
VISTLIYHIGERIGLNIAFKVIKDLKRNTIPAFENLEALFN